MRVGIRIWNVEKLEKFVDVIITYRWWVPGKDPWKVEARTEYVPAQSGEWVDTIHYNELGHMISLMDDKGEDIFFLKRLPNWPPSEFKVDDEGPAFQYTEGSVTLYANLAETIRWKIRWIG